MNNSMLSGLFEATMRHAATGAMTLLLAVAVLLSVAWAMAAGFRPRVR